MFSKTEWYSCVKVQRFNRADSLCIECILSFISKCLIPVKMSHQTYLAVPRAVKASCLLSMLVSHRTGESALDRIKSMLKRGSSADISEPGCSNFV